MELPRELSGKVADLATRLRELQQGNEYLQQVESRLQMGYDQAYSRLGWREKYCGGWFGGDVSAVKQAKSLREQLDAGREILAAAEKECQTTDLQINQSIREYLEQHDSEYRQINSLYGHFRSAREETRGFLSTIEEALSEIDDAQDMEMFDMFSNNKGIALMSYLENSEAQEAVQAVKNALPGFRQRLEAYAAFMQNLPPPTTLDFGDGLDFTFDLLLDGFDFMSLFTLEKLERAESELRELRARVDDVKGKIEHDCSKAEQNLLQYISNVRKKCTE